MNCPTCAHTMECLVIGNLAQPIVFWCPRCGSVKIQTDATQAPPVYFPALVERCRDLEKFVIAARMPASVALLALLRIPESINLPEARP